MNLTDLILHRGDVVHADGMLLVDEEGVWLQRDVIVSAAYPGPGQNRALCHSASAVAMHGEPARQYVAGRTGLLGAVEVTGHWDGGGLQVSEIATATAPAPQLEAPLLDPPGAPPQGGWPRRDTPLPDIPDDVAGLVGKWIAGAGTDHPIAVVASHHPDLAEERLRPDFGASLRIVASPWPPDLIQQWVSTLHREAGDIVLQPGLGLTSDGKVRLMVDVVRVNEALVALLASAPEGLIDIRPWLIRTGTGQ